MRYLTPIIFLLASCHVLAQDFELFKIQSAYYPKQPIMDSAIDGEISFREWSGEFTIPKPLKGKKIILIHKLGYSNLRVDTEGTLMNISTEATKYYHGISYNLGVVRLLNPTWRLLLNANPTLASDFTESLNGDDVLFQASAMAIKTKNRRFKYGFGLAYTTRLGRQLVVPIGVIKYNTPKMTLDVLLPNKLSIMFGTNKAFNFGLEARLNGGLFNNNSEIRTVNTIVDEMGYRRLNIGPAINFKLKEVIKIHLNGGIAAGRRLEFIDVAEETLDRTTENGPFFRLGLSFTPKGAGKMVN